RYQPSYAPVTLDPLSRIGCESGRGLGICPCPCWPARSQAPAAITTPATRPTATRTFMSLPLRRLLRSCRRGCEGRRTRTIPAGHLRLEFLVAEVRDVQPRV